MQQLGSNFRQKHSGFCLIQVLLLFGLVSVFVLLILDHVFNLRSNLLYFCFRDSKGPLQVQVESGNWVNVTDLSVSQCAQALNQRSSRQGAVWKSLRVRRKTEKVWQQVLQSCFSAEVEVLEFDPQYYQFSVSYLPQFKLTTARERLRTESAVFAVLANFRDPQGKPLGLVVHQGQQVNRAFPAWTGYFFVKDGRPMFGPKSLFDESQGVLSEATQGYPSVMKNHTVFPYVDLQSSRYFNGKRLSYRSLAGVRQNGQVVFVLSGRGGIMNVTETSLLAQKLNVQHATLLDGGKALQYSARIGLLPKHFHAYNVQWDLPGILKRERSPIFIVIKKK